ncbi:MAG: cystathionine beta-synthase [Deltaproteobacteria bacterium RIFCSPHIGHO2_02_FULL_40_11]|nr:MAG: cystathionine beta-synthase [Deltaproteobacteria bacterium RIFCSPHIGHO2_02_FULL_40_11]
MQVSENILNVIGNTPLVRLNKVTKGLKANVYAKVESLNPGGSVKDRIGVFIIEEAEKKGLLKPGGTIIEATSGNTGFGLAICAAVKGYKTIFVMPDKMSQEKIQNLRSFGARVIITPTEVTPDDPKSYYSVAKRLAEETPNSFYSNQYFNSDNPKAHYLSTGPELWQQTDGKIDALVCGMGTGGTISGAGKYLKEKNKKIQIVGVDPVGSIYLEYFKTKKMGEAKSYKIEGIGEDILPTTMHFEVVDDVVQVTDKEAFQMTRKLVTQEGLFVGGSSGAAVCGAIKYAQKIDSEKNIIVLLPDSGDRYLSKIFNDDWMRENGFLESKVELGLVRDILENMEYPEVFTAKKKDTLQTIITTFRERGFSQIPVLDGKKLLGIVTEADLLHHLVDHHHKADDPIEKMITKNFYQVSLDETVQKVADIIDQNKFVVVYESDKIHGLITKIDLLSYYSKRLK